MSSTRGLTLVAASTGCKSAIELPSTRAQNLHRRPSPHITAPPSGSLPDGGDRLAARARQDRDRKSTRLNSSHSQISYAVFCLKKTKMTHGPVFFNVPSLSTLLSSSTSR